MRLDDFNVSSIKTANAVAAGGSNGHNIKPQRCPNKCPLWLFEQDVSFQR